MQFNFYGYECRNLTRHPLLYIWQPLICLLLFTGCGSRQGAENSRVSDQFRDYWYTGKADVVSYDLSQSRYGEDRQGHAVLIFVTEPFSISRHVKLDHPNGSADEVTVMKLNFVKKFITGIYPYSLMLSTFTPVNLEDRPKPLKMDMTGQEWCGNVFEQMNRKGDAYVVRQFSYFENEGDTERRVAADLSEDGIWSLIRMDPSLLPTGKFDMLPGLYEIRLRHQPLVPQQVTASMEKGDVSSYKLSFENGRELIWRFDSSFPYQIRSWQESFTDESGKRQVTSARIKKVLHTDYWKYNASRYTYLRDSLGLNP